MMDYKERNIRKFMQLVPENDFHFVTTNGFIQVGLVNENYRIDGLIINANDKNSIEKSDYMNWAIRKAYHVISYNYSIYPKLPSSVYDKFVYLCNNDRIIYYRWVQVNFDCLNHYRIYTGYDNFVEGNKQQMYYFDPKTNKYINRFKKQFSAIKTLNL